MYRILASYVNEKKRNLRVYGGLHEGWWIFCTGERKWRRPRETRNRNRSPAMSSAYLSPQKQAEIKSLAEEIHQAIDAEIAGEPKGAKEGTCNGVRFHFLRTRPNAKIDRIGLRMTVQPSVRASRTGARRRVGPWPQRSRPTCALPSFFQRRTSLTPN
jgi:hypothetical protein